MGEDVEGHPVDVVDRQICQGGIGFPAFNFIGLRIDRINKIPLGCMGPDRFIAIFVAFGAGADDGDGLPRGGLSETTLDFL